MSKAAKYASLIALPNLAVVVAHQVAHMALGIHLSVIQNLYAIPVIGAAPVIAWALVLRGRDRAGWLLLIASLAGSLAFAGYHHFILVSPDHVSQIPDSTWGAVFLGTAHLMTVTEVIGLAAAMWVVTRLRVLQVARTY